MGPPGGPLHAGPLGGWLPDDDLALNSTSSCFTPCGPVDGRPVWLPGGSCSAGWGRGARRKPADVGIGVHALLRPPVSCALTGPRLPLPTRLLENSPPWAFLHRSFRKAAQPIALSLLLITNVICFGSRLCESAELKFCRRHAPRALAHSDGDKAGPQRRVLLSSRDECLVCDLMHRAITGPEPSRLFRQVRHRSGGTKII